MASSVFIVNSIERTGAKLYILRGKDRQGNPEVFNVLCEAFPQCEEILGRMSGTEIKRIFNGD